MIQSPCCLCLGLDLFSFIFLSNPQHICFDERRYEVGHIVCLSEVLDEGCLTFLAISNQTGLWLDTALNQPEVGSPLALLPEPSLAIEYERKALSLSMHF